MRIVLFFIFSIVFAGCTPNRIVSEGFQSDFLKIKPLGEQVFMHVSYLNTESYGKVACNGMVYFNENEAIIFDTPTNDTASAELLNWVVTKQGKNIKAVIVTHFHIDCLGGLKAFHDKNVQSYASNQTIALAKAANQTTLPTSGFNKSKEFEIGKTIVHTTFYGEGHTKDNVVGYIPEAKALFGGCLIKSLKAGKGYLGDANVSEWSATVSKIKKELPDLKIVVPGHGQHGDTALLDYTIELFKK